MQTVFIKNDFQKKWLQKLEQVRDVITQHAQMNDEQSKFPYENIDALKGINYPQLTLPVEFGGEGATLYDALMIHEKLASMDGSTALILGWSLLFIGDTFEHKPYAQEILEEIANESKQNALFNKAVSEYSMGSPARGGRPQTTASKCENGWMINGRKNYTTGSYALDYFITLAWIEEKNTAGFFMIPKHAEGVSIEENWDVIAMKSSGSHDLILKDVYVRATHLIEIPSYSTGFKLNSWLLFIPTTYLGIAQAARDYAIEFAKTHQPSSLQTPIIELPNVQALIGEMELSLMKARFTLYGAAEACMDTYRKQAAALTINVAKTTVTNEALHVVDCAMRIVGAKSLQQNNPLQRYYRDLRAGLHNPPMDDMTIAALAKAAIQEN
jgi:alkylation response protein AidB-like acyl-CoA dehydrogenase